MENEHIATAVKIFGGQSALARKLGVTQGTVWKWLTKATRISAENAIKIDKATGGKVPKKALRPDITW